MNQKDYKEIAGIINDVLPNDTYWKPKLCNKLADYFERKDKKEAERKLNSYYDKNEKDINRFRDFNQQQFLKDCGVK